MFNSISVSLFVSLLGGMVLTSCQSLDDSDPNRFPALRNVPLVVGSSIREGGAELFASDPVLEFQRTGSNPGPISILNGGEQVTILSSGGGFTRVRLGNGLEGYVSSTAVTRGDGYGTAGTDGNRFGAGNFHDDRFGSNDPPAGSATPPVTGGGSLAPHDHTPPPGAGNTDVESGNTDTIDLDSL